MKTALIWDAGGGIGGAITRQLAREIWQILEAGRNLNSFTDLTDFYEVELSAAFLVQSAITCIRQEVNEADLWVYACMVQIFHPISIDSHSVKGCRFR
jgi:NADP-dependent 3-hydroxy acid dehydrogenase YdfG